MDDYFAMRSGILNSPTMMDILAFHQVEDDFAPGDVLLFNKYVVHRSVMLGQGALPRRAAFVMRFVDIDSHYDLQRAMNLEYPAEKYGYKAFTRSHIEIGAPDGARLADCSYFADRDRRMIRRAPWAMRSPASLAGMRRRARCGGPPLRRRAQRRTA